MKDDKKFLNALVFGYNIEKEHIKTVGGKRTTIARIALDHLDEDPNYYKKLAKMEKKKVGRVS